MPYASGRKIPAKMGVTAVKGDDAKLRVLLARLAAAARGDAMRALRRELALRTAEEIDESFRARRAPDGRSWPTTKRGGPPLERSGALRRGFDVTPTESGIRVTNSASYANVHQHGGRIRRRRKRTRGRRKARLFSFGGGVIPPRPMVPAARWGPAPTARLRVASSRIVKRFFLAR
jgi:phage gpG-like protein